MTDNTVHDLVVFLGYLPETPTKHRLALAVEALVVQRDAWQQAHDEQVTKLLEIAAERDEARLKNLDLLIYNDGLTKKLESAQLNWSAVCRRVLELETERDEYRADAERYRFIRDRVMFGYPSSEGCNNKHAYLVVTGYGDFESEDITDKAVDTLMKESE